jgi:ribosomal-protein-alanine acetyltransferase/tRNA threonylcarbamoyl adenosine modification protein YeaZ
VSSLVIDTSSTRTIVALFDGDREVFSDFHEGATEHGEALPRLVSRALESAQGSGSAIHEVIVGMGPGPYTGLRVGIVFAQTFASARLIPCNGRCSLDGIDVGISGDYIVTTDARRKEIYWAQYRDGERASGPHVGRVTDIDEYSEPKFGFGLTTTLYPSPHLLLRASEEVSQPMYLRRPDALPQITYREMNHFDLGAVHAMERESYEHDPWTLNQFKEELSEVPRSRHYVVACEGDRIVGYAGIAITLDVADIHTITVDKAFRRRGIGKSLLSQIESWAISRGAKQLMLEMRVGNTEAQPLYEKFGYSVISLRKNYYGKGVDALVMGKSIE